ncbi:MAG: hypothetical protein H6510_07485 [Acidobacteria bacterium]|nr:hypothetical protein [Acidobacteriota bacterium]
MNTTIDPKDLGKLSTLLRILFGTLFLGAALIKVKGGMQGSVDYYLSMFQDSLLPSALVRTHAQVIMLLEFAVAIWLFSGFRLRWAWLATAGLLWTLAFGMIFALKFDVAAHNYFYFFLAGLGFVLAPFDRFQWGNGAQA